MLHRVFRATGALAKDSIEAVEGEEVLTCMLHRVFRATGPLPKNGIRAAERNMGAHCDFAQGGLQDSLLLFVGCLLRSLQLSLALLLRSLGRLLRSPAKQPPRLSWTTDKQWRRGQVP